MRMLSIWQHSVRNFKNSVLKTRYAHISGKAERDGRQAHTPRRQTTQTVYRLHARGGGGIQENYVGNDLLKKDNEKTIFYLKNLFDSEILPIFAARMRVAYRRDDIKLRNRSLYIKPQVEYLWL